MFELLIKVTIYVRITKLYRKYTSIIIQMIQAHRFFNNYMNHRIKLISNIGLQLENYLSTMKYFNSKPSIQINSQMKS